MESSADTVGKRTGGAGPRNGRMRRGRSRSDIVADAIRCFAGAISRIKSTNLEHTAAARPTGD